MVGQYSMQICPTKQTLPCRSVVQNKLCYWSGNTQCRCVVQNKLLLVGQYSTQICHTKQTAIGPAILNADLSYKTNSAIGPAILNAEMSYKNKLCYWLGKTQYRSVKYKINSATGPAIIDADRTMRKNICLRIKTEGKVGKQTQFLQQWSIWITTKFVSATAEIATGHTAWISKAC